MNTELMLSPAEGGNMGKKDEKLRNFLEDETLYADLWNGGVFEGKQVVHADELEESNPILLKANEGQSKERIRDVVMKESRNGLKFVVWALENQDKIDYRMPARVMLSEALEYDRQIRKISDENKKHAKEREEANQNIGKSNRNDGEYLYHFHKEDKICPVVTLVLYWGNEEWYGPKTLHEMMDFNRDSLGEDAGINTEIKKLVPEMPLHFLNASNIENTENFTTSLGPFFELYKRRNDKEEFIQYLTTNEVADRMDDKGWQALIDLTESKRLQKVIEARKAYSKNDMKGEEYMCKALEDYYNEAKEEGIKEGIKVTIRTCKNFGIDIKKMKNELMKEYKIEEETAEEYLRLYW